MPLLDISPCNSCFPFFLFSSTPTSFIDFQNISAIPHLEDRLVNTHLSLEEIDKIVTPILKNILTQVHFNALNLVCQFIDYYNNLDYEITPLKALETFTVDEESTMKTTHGGNCWEILTALLNHLPKSLCYNLIPSSVPTQTPKYSHQLCHIAAVIVYNNPKNPLDTSYILLDPSFGFEELIIVPVNKISKPIASFVDDNYIFYHENDKIVSKRLKTDQNGQVAEIFYATYFLKKITNFPEVSIKPLLASMRNIPLLTYGSLENSSELAVRLDKEIITWTVGLEQKTPISFKEFLSKNFQFDTNFIDSPSLDMNQVNASIEKIILNKRLLNTLHTEYIDILKESSRNNEFLMYKNS